MFTILRLSNEDKYARTYRGDSQSIFQTLIDREGAEFFSESVDDLLAIHQWSEDEIDAYDFSNEYESLDAVLAAINRTEIRYITGEEYKYEIVIVEYDEKSWEVLAEIKIKSEGDIWIDGPCYFFDQRVEVTYHDEQGNTPNIGWLLRGSDNLRAIKKYLTGVLEELMLKDGKFDHEAVLEYFKSIKDFYPTCIENLPQTLREYFVFRIHQNDDKDISEINREFIEITDYKEVIGELLTLLTLEEFNCLLSLDTPKAPVWIDEKHNQMPEKDTYEWEEILLWGAEKEKLPRTNMPFSFFDLRPGFNPYRVHDIFDNFLNQATDAFKEEEVASSNPLLKAKSFSERMDKITTGFFKPKQHQNKQVIESDEKNISKEEISYSTPSNALN